MSRGLSPRRHFLEVISAIDMMNQRASEFIISYNDCGTIRDWFKDHEQFYPKWQYSFQQGETRKKNEDGESIKGAKDSRKTGDEILIVKSTYTIKPFVAPVLAPKVKKIKVEKKKKGELDPLLFSQCPPTT